MRSTLGPLSLPVALPFLLTSAVDLVARWSSLTTVTLFTKPLLMPTLALLAAFAAPSEAKLPRRLLLVGLALSWAGDLLLMGEGLALFAAGLGAFFLAHVAYLVLFARALEGRVSPFALVYAAAYVGHVFVLAPRVGVLVVPVLAYGAVLCAMAALATRGGAALALGGAAFLVSDAILALGRFVPEVTIPRLSFVVMLTYLAAQALIVLGVTKRLRDLAD